MLKRFFDKFFDLFSDRTEENFCRRLIQLGIEAEITRRRPLYESKQLAGIPFHPVGFINIGKGPISRINISRCTYQGLEGAESDYRIDYVVPDSRMTKELAHIQLWVAFTRTEGFLGHRVVDLRWDGNDFGSGVKDLLNADESLKAQIMEVSAEDLQIGLNIEAKCWFITIFYAHYASPPGHALWGCYQAIAERLLGGTLA